MNGERQAFEAAIRADRYDGVTRKVFADWLDEHDCPEEADRQRSWTARWQQAEDWLQDFCKRVDLNYDHLLRAAVAYLDGEDDKIAVTLNTSNAILDENMDDLWAHVGVVLRRDVNDDKRADVFSCGNDCFPDGLGWECCDNE